MSDICNDGHRQLQDRIDVAMVHDTISEADLVLIKPVSPIDLANLVRRLLSVSNGS